MKSVAVFAVCLLLAAAHVQADDMHTQMLGSSYGGASSGGSYGGGASIPAPPCANNYLFSCQPNLAPAPCSPPAPAPAPAPAQSYGSAGAYSQYQPIYTLPVHAKAYHGIQAY